jgi:hypothetical protein
METVEGSMSAIFYIIAFVIFLLTGVEAQDELKSSWTQTDGIAFGLAFVALGLALGGTWPVWPWRRE